MTSESVVVDSVEKVTRHLGAETCQYDCDAPAEYDITVRKDGQTTTFASCQSCANENGIWPEDHLA